jgi:hypothetical protein
VHHALPIALHALHGAKVYIPPASKTLKQRTPSTPSSRLGFPKRGNQTSRPSSNKPYPCFIRYTATIYAGQAMSFSTLLTCKKHFLNCSNLAAKTLFLFGLFWLFGVKKPVYF